MAQWPNGVKVEQFSSIPLSPYPIKLLVSFLPLRRYAVRLLVPCQFVKHSMLAGLLLNYDMNRNNGVMMKRKNKEQEEITQNNIDKSTENKENTNYPDNVSSDSELNGPIENANEIKETSEQNADKMVLEVKAAGEKLAEMQDKYIRLSAEFDNYRKRTLREKMDMTKYAGENLFLSIIPLVDDFERALRHMDNTPECEAMKNGIEIIYGKFSDFLKQNGVKEIESLNSNFNVDLHEAVAKVPVEEAEKKGKVIDVVEKGYYLQDKVLRFSKVIVGE